MTCHIISFSRAEQSRAEQSRAEQSRAEQSRAEQSRAEQSRASIKITTTHQSSLLLNNVLQKKSIFYPSVSDPKDTYIPTMCPTRVVASL